MKLITLALHSFSYPTYVSAQLELIEAYNTIRYTPTLGCFAADDKNHTFINIKNVRTSNGVIVLSFPLTAQSINTFIATPDDT